MRTITAREANQQFSALLSQVERGEEIVIIKRGREVAVLMPPRPHQTSTERNRAILHAMKLADAGLPWGQASTRRGKWDER